MASSQCVLFQARGVWGKGGSKKRAASAHAAHFVRNEIIIVVNAAPVRILRVTIAVIPILICRAAVRVRAAGHIGCARATHFARSEIIVVVFAAPELVILVCVSIAAIPVRICRAAVRVLAAVLVVHL